MRHREDLDRDLEDLASQLSRKGMTMKELIAECGVSERTIHRWFDTIERDGRQVTSTRKNPKIYRVVK